MPYVLIAPFTVAEPPALICTQFPLWPGIVPTVLIEPTATDPDPYTPTDPPFVWRLPAVIVPNWITMLPPPVRIESPVFIVNVPADPVSNSTP